MTGAEYSERADRMADPTYYRAAGRTYMVFPISGAGEQTGYQYRMLTSNHIDGILDCSIREIDSETYLYADFTGCQSLRNLYQTKTISGTVYRKLLENLEKLAETLGSYLLDPERVPLCADMVFFHYAEERFLFVYLPEIRLQPDLFRFLSEHIDTAFKDETASVFRLSSIEEEGTEAIGPHLLREKKELTPEEIPEPVREYVPEERIPFRTEEEPGRELEQEKESALRKREEPSPRNPGKWLFILKWILIPVFLAAAAGLLWTQHVFYLTEAIRNLCRAGAAVLTAASVFVTADQILSIRERKRRREVAALREAGPVTKEYEMTRPSEKQKERAGVPDEEPATVLLRPDMAGRLYGTGKAKGCTIILEQLPLTVGKSAEYADEVLGDPSVSRVHARFTKNRRGEIEICDLGSTNGTKINGISLGMQEKKTIERGDEIQIGALTFYYR